MRSFLTFIYLLPLVHLAPTCLGEPFRRGGSGFGAAEFSGKMALWFEEIPGIALEGAREIPLFFKFSSTDQIEPDSSMGMGWQFPLQQSSVINRNEDSVELRLPGGERRTLFRSPNNDQEYRTKDGKWVGTKAGRDGFLVKSADWDLQFDGGRLVTMVTPLGELVELRRQDGRIESIKSSISGELARFAYDSDGIISKIQGPNGVRDLLSFERTERPLTSTVSGNSFITDLVASISGIQTFSGERLALRISDEVAEDSVELEVMAGEISGSLAGRYKWDRMTRNLLSDSDYFYRTIGEASEGIERVSKLNGKSESVAHDKKKGLSTYTYFDGSEKIVSYIKLNGRLPTRKIILRDPEGNEAEIFRAHFDSEGNVIKAFEAESDHDLSGEIETMSREALMDLIAEGRDLGDLFENGQSMNKRK